ncbi:MAG: flagellar basal body rod protein FlgC [Alphaproteobacteria bacterium]|nr:flagellar basal body rod protein FlgC [Alphaproteobacteria bacterium]
MVELIKASKISASGLKAQAERLRVISENLANAGSTAKVQGQDPYRRKLVTFANELDRALGARTVKVRQVTQDKSEFIKRFDPGHPAADKDGYVLTPNVNPLIELADLREAQRSYEANLSAIEISKSMVQRTVELLRS